MPDTENAELDELFIADETEAVVYYYSDGVERVEGVVKIKIDDGQRHYVTKRDGSGLILPPPDRIEVVPKAGRSPFAIAI
jgi:hypothetical protein